MLRILTEGWYLCCYKYRRKNLNICPNIYPTKVAFFLEGIQQSSLILKQTNKQTKQDSYFDKTIEKSSNYCKWIMDCVLT